MRTAIIAQARSGSTRLPGKVLRPLAGLPAMAHTLRRASAVPGADVVVLATTELPEDDAVAEAAEACGVAVFRGAEHDVLDRYLQAATAVEADIVMRVTCDCPLLDPDVCAAVLRLRADQDADYASNVERPEWPHGLDCEAVTRAALERAGAAAHSAREREHVTQWLRENAGVRRCHLAGPGGAAARQRWTLDYPEDLAFLEALFAVLPAPPAMPGWREVMDAVAAHPELAAINRQRVDAARAV